MTPFLNARIALHPLDIERATVWYAATGVFHSGRGAHRFWLPPTVPAGLQFFFTTSHRSDSNSEPCGLTLSFIFDAFRPRLKQLTLDICWTPIFSLMP